MEVHEDFFVYKSGIYKHTDVNNYKPQQNRKHATHSVRITGYVFSHNTAQPLISDDKMKKMGVYNQSKFNSQAYNFWKYCQLVFPGNVIERHWSPSCFAFKVCCLLVAEKTPGRLTLKPRPRTHPWNPLSGLHLFEPNTDSNLTIDYDSDTPFLHWWMFN